MATKLRPREVIQHARRYLPECGAVLTGLLLAASFAPLEWKQAAWVALVPLVISVRSVSPWRAGRLGFLAGLVFWLLTVLWLTHVSILGWFILAAYCALYIVPFAVVVSWGLRRWSAKSVLHNLLMMIMAALAWAALEYLRSTVFTGFPWNPLGQSQYENLTLLQIAEWGGVYAVSTLLVWMNMAIALTIMRYAECRGRLRHRWHPELIAGVLVWALVHTYGWRVITRGSTEGETVQLALIQPNIPQTEKWTPEYIDTIYKRLLSLSDAARRVNDLDLLVWPETAVPDDVRTSPRSYDLVYRLVTNGVPILVGSMDTEWQDYDKPLYYNSSFLFDENGRIAGEYDKQHLVVFGEYVPFRHALPFLTAMTPISESFSAGRTSTVMRLPDRDIPFSVLICFEDSVSRIARSAVRNGARLLINQTNDAWFDVSSGSKQHMIHCVLRCIENRVPAVRATNTGITCAIDRYGRIRDVLRGDDGSPVIAGFQITEASVPTDTFKLTFYTKYGDLFAWVATVLLGVMLCTIGITERKARSKAKPARH
jgi:apolipoprotein N-acyltransferase